MQTIGNFWWLWLTLLVIFGGYTLFNQFKRIKRMGSSMSSAFNRPDFDTIDNAVPEFTRGIGLLMISGFAAWVCGMLLFLAVVNKAFMK